MNFEFVKSTTRDGLILQGMLFCSSGKKVIIHIHGMSGNCWENGFVTYMAKEYPKQNFDFLTVETRGSELVRWFNKSDRTQKLIGNSYEIFEESQQDIGAWVDFCKKRGYSEIYLQGHSLGCAKIVYFMVNNKKAPVKSLILISPSDMLGLVLEPNTLSEHKAFVKEAESLVKSGKENELLTGLLWGYARLSAKTYLNFFREDSSTAIFNYFKPSLGFGTISKVSIPILAILGTKDDGVATDPYKSLDLLKKEAKHCPNFKGEVYVDAQHNFFGFESRLVKSVVKFLK